MLAAAHLVTSLITHRKHHYNAQENYTSTGTSGEFCITEIRQNRLSPNLFEFFKLDTRNNFIVLNQIKIRMNLKYIYLARSSNFIGNMITQFYDTSIKRLRRFDKVRKLRLTNILT